LYEIPSDHEPLLSLLKTIIKAKEIPNFGISGLTKVLHSSLEVKANCRLAFIFDPSSFLFPLSSSLQEIIKQVSINYTSLNESSFGILRKQRMVKKAELIIST
jgi:hypothetical protein